MIVDTVQVRHALACRYRTLAEGAEQLPPVTKARALMVILAQREFDNAAIERVEEVAERFGLCLTIRIGERIQRRGVPSENG